MKDDIQNAELAEENKGKVESTSDGSSVATALGYAVGTAAAGAGLYNTIATNYNDIASYAEEKIAAQNPQINSLDDILCKPSEQIPGEELTQSNNPSLPSYKKCWRKHGGIYKYIADKAAGGDSSDNPPDENPALSQLLEFLSEVSKPTDLVGCISPHFVQFFSLIPYQILLGKTFDTLLRGLADKEQVEKVLSKTKCGPQLIAAYDEYSKEFPRMEPFTLPPLPYVRLPNLIKIIEKVILDAICLALCNALSPTMGKLAETLLEQVNKLNNAAFLNPADPGLTLTVEDYEKVNLNKYVKSNAITDAIAFDVIKRVYISDEDMLQLYSDFFDYIFEEEKIPAGFSTFLLYGQTTCEILDILVKYIEQEDTGLLKLSMKIDGQKITEAGKRQKVLEFFQFIKDRTSLLDAINDSIGPNCPIEPCEVDLDDIDIDGLNNFCGPELNIDDFIDVNDVLSSLGIDSLSADAFMQAASQYLDQYDKLRKEYIPLSSPSNSYYPHFMIHYPARRLRYILDSYEDSNPPITERTVEYEHGKMSQEIAENQRNEFIKNKFKKAVAEAKEKMGGKSMEQFTQIAEEAFDFNIERRKFWNQASKNYLTVHAKKKAKGSS